jgi:hypothetical protein
MKRNLRKEKGKLAKENLKAIRDYFISLSNSISEGNTPVVKPVQQLYEKYVVPDIKEK